MHANQMNTHLQRLPNQLPRTHHDKLRHLQSKLVTALDTCTNLNQLKQVHAHIYRTTLHQCSYVITKLLRTLTKLNLPTRAYPTRAFLQVHSPNPFLYTALLRGHASQGSLTDAVQVYRYMRTRDVGPVSFTFSAIFKACGETLDASLGRQFHAQTILVGGFVSDLYVGNTLIDMYVKCGSLACARKAFDEMPVRDEYSWTLLIVAYARCGDMRVAGELFDGMPRKDMVVWTAVVMGYAQNARPREAVEVFERMLGEGVETDEVTLASVVSACAQLGAVKYARWIRDIAERLGFGARRNVVVGSALIDMYSKCGSLEEAEMVFREMEVRNVYSYSSMIMGFAMHGQAHSALRLFDEMTKTEIKPNGVTFIGVLTACSHAGMVERGKHVFDSMEKIYGVTPRSDHYACMVDILGRAGCLNEALELVKTMPMEPHGGVWGALLGACRIHGNPDVARIAAGNLFKLEPDGVGNFILLSNVYASAGLWDDVVNVRKLMKRKRLKKSPASSWVEGKNGVIHEFLAGDNSHPRTSEIKQALEDLLDRLKANGYQPILSSVMYDVSDEEKKRSLMTHSEKLALAYGLLTTGEGDTIRIMKNIRICEDCHSVMCSASHITGREIIVRDNMRFHHFRNGTCSCGNFW